MKKEHSHKDNLKVVYEDNHLIVVNKRAGDIVQGDKTGDKPLSDVVKSYLKENKEIFNKIETQVKELLGFDASNES